MAAQAADSLSDRVRQRLDALAERYRALGEQLEDPAVLSDHRRVRDLSIQRAGLAPAAEGYTRYQALLTEAAELRGAVESDADPELAELAREELPRLESEAADTIARVKAALVNAEDRGVGSVILEIRAGTGGDEAGLWARDLFDMYQKYAARKGWNIETLDLTGDASLGGIRHVVANISGEGVWSELAFEAGVHSVKRVPATEAAGRIHTSTATVAVLPEPEEVQVSIDWSEVDETVTTSQGPGGQNVNKVATAVRLLHRPTGIEVRMQESKSQQQNRERAKRLLLARLYELERQKVHAARTEARNSQIGTGQRSEKVRVYRYQDGIVADERLAEKFQLRDVIGGDLGAMMQALLEQETTRRLEAL
ncbi:MAG: PCRF domain-containing protein [Phycisphaerales bacterium]